MIIDIIFPDTYQFSQINSQQTIVEKYVPESKSAITINYNIKELPKETNNRQYCTFPILDQGNQNGCVEFALVNMIQYYQNKNLFYSPLSAEALYYWVREYEGNTNKNSPTYPNNALDLAQKVGVPLEECDPNIEQNEFIRPSQQAIKSAILSRIDGWESLDLTGNKSEEIAKQLANGNVVLMCFYMNDHFISPPLDGIVDVDNKKIDETKTHAIMVVDYRTLDNGKRLYLCLNTWSEYYGIQPEGTNSGGWVWLTEEYINRMCYFAGIIEFGKLQGIINSVNNNKYLIG